MKGISPRNLRYKRDFAAAYGETPIWQQAVAKLPWGHNTVLLDRATGADRLWYAQAAVDGKWSRATLVHQIETGLHLRQGKAITNFEHTMPADRQAAAALSDSREGASTTCCRKFAKIASEAVRER